MLPGTWFYETGLNDENSSVSGGVFSGGPGCSGSAPASSGMPAEFSPLPNSVVNFGNTNFDNEINLNLLSLSDNTLPGSRSVTESVEVPSSEHVAEIVGRQGCKIKALRAKTNTYIKTPVRGEEPFFVVTGRFEDVFEAKKEIQCAAEHFTQIRASRRHSQGGAPAPGHVTAYVRVPLRVVGLVVGPKGGTIKRIQQDTHTYIITPSREREPIFEVTGLPQNVDAARKEIEQHIYQRTGNMPITDQSQSIANFDLNAAAQLAAQSTTVNTKRPDYGALAAVLPNQNQRENTSSFQFFDNHSTHQQQNNWNSMCNNDEMFKSLLSNSNKQNSLTALDNLFFGDLDFLSNTTYQSQNLSKQNNNINNNNKCNLNKNSQFLFSDSNNQFGSDNLFNNKSYQTWSDGLTLEIGTDFSNFKTESFSSAALVSSANPTVNNLKANSLEFFKDLTISNSSDPNGLFSINSTSRDEGLGDSPTDSKGSNYPFDLMIPSLWSNVDFAGPMPRDKLDTAKTS